MRAAPVVCVALVLCAACYHGPDDPGPKTAPVITRARLDMPCGDSTYLRLRGVPVDSLSDADFTVFRVHEQACLQAEVARRAGSRSSD